MRMNDDNYSMNGTDFCRHVAVPTQQNTHRDEAWL